MVRRAKGPELCLRDQRQHLVDVVGSQDERFIIGSRFQTRTAVHDQVEGAQQRPIVGYR